MKATNAQEKAKARSIKFQTAQASLMQVNS
jgi:hypothetical protein